MIFFSLEFDESFKKCFFRFGLIFDIFFMLYVVSVLQQFRNTNKSSDKCLTYYFTVNLKFRS